MALNTKIYNITWDNITDNMLAWYLRNLTATQATAKNPTWLVWWMRCIGAAMQSITDRFFVAMFDINEKLRYNSQVEVLNFLLNDNFDPLDRAIFYSDEFGVLNQIYTMYLQSEGQPGPFSLYMQGESFDPILYPPFSLNIQAMAAGVVDFTINVPDALIFDSTRMYQLITQYKPAGKRFNITNAAGYSPDVQTVLNNLPDAVGGDMLNAIIKFVDAEVANGNWYLSDEFWLFTTNLGNTLNNSLTGWRAGITATNNGATVTGNGFDFDGVADYLHLNYTPSDVAQLWREVNAHQSAFLYRNDVAGGDAQATLMGGRNGVAVGESRITHTPTSQTLAGCNDQTQVGAVAMPSEALVSIGRQNISDLAILHDGVLQDTINRRTNAITTVPLYLGALNDNGTPTEHYDGVVTTVCVGAAAGFDFASHNANVRALLTDFGVLP